MGGRELVVALRPMLRKRAEDHPCRVPADGFGEEGGDLVEESCIALRPEKCSQQLTPRPRIVPETTPVSLEPLLVALSAGERLHAAEEIDGDVPVPDLPDQLGEATQPSVEDRESLSLRQRNELAPDGEPGAEPSQVAVKAMERPGRRTRAVDDLLGTAGDRSGQAFELAPEPREPSGLRGAHGTEVPSVRHSPFRLVERCGPAPNIGSEPRAFRDPPAFPSVERARSNHSPAEHDRPDIGGSSTLAVIDVGSNTARLVVFEAVGDSIRAIFQTKDAPRLGSRPGPRGELSEVATERGVATVRRFARLLELFEVPKALSVATSAVRDAPNGPDFVREVERATGVKLRVLTGTEEARYGYLGAASAWALKDDLVLDLGGGSLQLAEVRGGELRNSVSLPLGVLRLSQRFFEHDPPKRREWDELREAVRTTVTSAVEAFGGTGYRLLGMGGTIRSLARAAIELREYPIRRVHGYPLYDHDLEALGELLGEMTAAKRRSIPGIGGDRADVVLAGIVVLEELLRATGAERALVCGTGIREGVALEAIGAHLPATAEVLAERSALAAARSFAFRIGHGREVAETALALFRLLGPRFDAGASEGLALRVAAWMHDAGTSIDLWNHARHSAYLIENCPIWGLDQREVLLAAMTTYLHEGDAPPSEWKRAYLPIIRSPDIEIAVRLGAILEVAEILAPARPHFTVTSAGKALSLSFSAPVDTTLSPGWAE